MQAANESPALPSQVVSEHTHLVVPSLPHWIEATVDYLRQRAILCGACHDSRAVWVTALISVTLDGMSGTRAADPADWSSCRGHGWKIRRSIR